MTRLPFPERVLHQHIATLGKTGLVKFWLAFAPTLFNANEGELNVFIDEIPLEIVTEHASRRRQ